MRTQAGRYDGYVVSWLDHREGCDDAGPRLRVIGTGVHWFGRTAPGARDRFAGLDRAMQDLGPSLPRSAVAKVAIGTVGECASPVYGLRITAQRWSDLDALVPIVGAFMKQHNFTEELDLEAPAPSP